MNLLSTSIIETGNSKGSSFLKRLSLLPALPLPQIVMVPSPVEAPVPENHIQIVSGPEPVTQRRHQIVPRRYVLLHEPAHGPSEPHGVDVRHHDYRHQRRRAAAIDPHTPGHQRLHKKLLVAVAAGRHRRGVAL